MKVSLLSHTYNPEELVAMSAKLCYSPISVEEIRDNLDEEKVKKFIEMLMNLGHESPLEHVKFTFAIEGVSRALTHQLVRHRIASYSQQSQRYVKLDSFEYIIPKEIENNPKARRRFIQEMERSQKAYNDLVEMLLADKIREYWIGEGVPDDVLQERDDEDLIKEFKETYGNIYKIIEKKAIENARYVLPNSCETKIIVTMNARALSHFFEERCCNRAQDEIRRLAWEMLRLAREKAEELFKYAGPKCLRLGYCPENDMQCEESKGRIYTHKDVYGFVKNLELNNYLMKGDKNEG